MTKPTPPGWYPYMNDSNRNERYWNGTNWENRFRRRGETAEFPESPKPEAASKSTRSAHKDSSGRSGFWVGALVVTLVIGGIAYANTGGKDESEATPVATATTTTAKPTPATTTRSAPQSTTTQRITPTMPAAASSLAPDSGFSNEDLFLATLSANDILIPDDQLMVNLGRAVCSDFDKGKSFAAVGFSMMSKSDGLYSLTEIGYIMGAAVPAFCPEHRDVIPSN